MSTIEEMEQSQHWKYPHVVRAALDYDRGNEGSSWRLADALAEDIDQGRAIARAPGVNTGLRAGLDEAYREARNAGAKNLHVKTLAKAYWVGVAWPREDRVASASYRAHAELAAGKYDGKRKARLEKLVARSTDGYVTGDDVRLWKSSVEPAKPPVPFLDQLENAVVSALRHKGSPWDRVAEDDRRAIGAMLRRYAAQIETGEFA